MFSNKKNAGTRIETILYVVLNSSRSRLFPGLAGTGFTRKLE